VLFTGVRVQVPPRAPKKQSKDCFFFCPVYPCQNGKNGWIFCFWNLTELFCLVASAPSIHTWLHFVLHIPSSPRRRATKITPEMAKMQSMNASTDGTYIMD